ncbi:MAG: hypothetical protein ACD_67C00095G0001, partial [uncultured bacterium]
MLWMLVGCAIFNVSANIIFIPTYSYTAAAIISAMTEFLVAFIGLILTVKYINYRPSIKNFSRILFSGLAMATFLFIFRSSGFVLL